METWTQQKTEQTDKRFTEKDWMIDLLTKIINCLTIEKKQALEVWATKN